MEKQREGIRKEEEKETKDREPVEDTPPTRID